MLSTVYIIIISIANWWVNASTASTAGSGTSRTRSRTHLPKIHSTHSTPSRRGPHLSTRKLDQSQFSAMPNHALQTGITTDAIDIATVEQIAHELSTIGLQIQAMLAKDILRNTSTMDQSTDIESLHNIIHLRRLDFNTSSNNLDTTEITDLKNRLQSSNDTISALQSKILLLQKKQNKHLSSVFMLCGICTLITGLICAFIMFIMHYFHTKKHAPIKKIHHMNEQMENAAPVFAHNLQHRDSQQNKEGIKLENCEVQPGSWKQEKLDKYIPNSIEVEEVLMDDIVGSTITDIEVIEENMCESFSDEEGMDEDNPTLVWD